LRAFCRDAEVTPTHPCRLEQRVSENSAIHEDLYVCDPSASAVSFTGLHIASQEASGAGAWAVPRV